MSALSHERWAQLWRDASGQGEGRVWFEALAARYSEPHRYYHTGRHIGECLEQFDVVRHLASQPAAVELALWFHDAIYDTHANDNEEQSAALAQRCLEDAAAKPELGLAVRDLILATKTHEHSTHPDAPLLVDVDLSILGKDETRFFEYEEQIRQEYAWVPESVFRSKRAEILKRFLDRKSIFLTDWFIERHEKQARLNLHASLRRLEGVEGDRP